MLFFPESSKRRSEISLYYHRRVVDDGYFSRVQLDQRKKKGKKIIYKYEIIKLIIITLQIVRGCSIGYPYNSGGLNEIRRRSGKTRKNPEMMEKSGDNTSV